MNEFLPDLADAMTPTTDLSRYSAAILLDGCPDPASNDAPQGDAIRATLPDMLRLRQFFDGLGPSLFFGLLTVSGEILFANRAALDAVLLQPEDVLGHAFESTPWWAIPYSRERLRAAIRDGAHGIPSRFDVDVPGFDGRVLTMDFSLQPMPGRDGNVEYLVVFARDVSERVAALAAPHAR
jgi:PAS domain S-box-containing protein